MDAYHLYCRVPDEISLPLHQMLNLPMVQDNNTTPVVNDLLIFSSAPIIEKALE